MPEVRGGWGGMITMLGEAVFDGTWTDAKLGALYRLLFSGHAELGEFET